MDINDKPPPASGEVSPSTFNPSHKISGMYDAPPPSEMVNGGAHGPVELNGEHEDMNGGARGSVEINKEDEDFPLPPESLTSEHDQPDLDIMNDDVPPPPTEPPPSVPLDELNQDDDIPSSGSKAGPEAVVIEINEEDDMSSNSFSDQDTDEHEAHTEVIALVENPEPEIMTVPDEEVNPQPENNTNTDKEALAYRTSAKARYVQKDVIFEDKKDRCTGGCFAFMVVVILLSVGALALSIVVYTVFSNNKNLTEENVDGTNDWLVADLEIILTGTFTNNLYNPETIEYKQVQEEFIRAMNGIMSNTRFQSSFFGTVVNGFRNGSIVCHSSLFFTPEPKLFGTLEAVLTSEISSNKPANFLNISTTIVAVIAKTDVKQMIQLFAIPEPPMRTTSPATNTASPTTKKATGETPQGGVTMVTDDDTSGMTSIGSEVTFSTVMLRATNVGNTDSDVTTYYSGTSTSKSTMTAVATTRTGTTIRAGTTMGTGKTTDTGTTMGTGTTVKAMRSTVMRKETTTRPGTTLP